MKSLCTFEDTQGLGQFEILLPTKRVLILKIWEAS